MQIRKKLGISVSAFILRLRHQKNNDVSKYLTMTFFSSKANDLLTKATDPYHFFNQKNRGGGAESAPMTTKVKNTP